MVHSLCRIMWLGGSPIDMGTPIFNNSSATVRSSLADTGKPGRRLEHADASAEAVGIVSVSRKELAATKNAACFADKDVLHAPSTPIKIGLAKAVTPAAVAAD